MMKNEINLKSLIFSEVGSKVLRFFSENSSGAFYSSEISKKAEMSMGAVNQAVRALKAKGILFDQKKGRMIFYRLNLESEVVKHFKVFETVLNLSPLIQKIKPFTDKIILFGSAAVGNNNENSDIDLCIIGDDPRVEKIVNDFQTKVKLQSIIKTYLEYIELSKENSVFFENINHGIVLWEKA